LQVRQNVIGCPPVPFDPDTDSGCADVSHCNDDLSSGSDRSSKDIETGMVDIMIDNPIATLSAILCPYN